MCSCMEHSCRDCGHEWFDNSARAPCTWCGSTNVAHFFDEDPHDFDDEDTAVWGEDDE